jgi:hypothetical protein
MLPELGYPGDVSAVGDAEILTVVAVGTAGVRTLRLLS